MRSANTFNKIIQQPRLLNRSYTMLSMVCWAWWQQLGRRLRCHWHRYLLRTNYQSRPAQRLMGTSAKQFGSLQENIIILLVMKVVAENWWVNTYGERQKHSSDNARMRYRDSVSLSAMQFTLTAVVWVGFVSCLSQVSYVWNLVPFKMMELLRDRA